MVDASSTGFGQAKNRSINVEVNLLQDWALERVASQAEYQRKLIVLFAVCTVGVLMIPVFSRWRSVARVSAGTAQKEAARLGSEQKALAKKVTRLTPSIDFAEMFSKSKQGRQILFHETARVFSAAPIEVKFESFKVEVMNGELQIKVAAYAKNSGLGRDFVERAGLGKNVLSSNQTSLREKGLDGIEGVDFDYSKRVKVTK